MSAAPWTFGEAPLPETCAIASLLRTIAGHAIAIEQPTETLADTIAALHAVEQRLRADLPASVRPRIGPRDEPERRVYLDHSRDVGRYNPAVPEYRLTCADDRADGSVTFPLLYEGPPGTVHGGFLAVLFDCVLQQLSCDLGTTGSTAEIQVRYRRPAPLHVPLRITAVRAVSGTRITSRAHLHRDDELLCEATMTSIAIERDALPAVSPRHEP